MGDAYIVICGKKCRRKINWTFKLRPEVTKLARISIGAPDQNERHAEAVANFALDMRDRLERLKHTEAEVPNQLQIRIGMHSG